MASLPVRVVQSKRSELHGGKGFVIARGDDDGGIGSEMDTLDRGCTIVLRGKA